MAFAVMEVSVQVLPLSAGRAEKGAFRKDCDHIYLSWTVDSKV